ncbi:MAG: PilZ domain-containing protein, partial [Armatimonadetes bacterium]|nr:PilZ domain-containing protein [Armatimonadota bacterium]
MEVTGWVRALWRLVRGWRRPALGAAPLAQQRKALRVNAKYTVVCHAPDGTFKATLQDMSVSGMRLESPRPLKPGDLLSIRCDQVYHSGAVTAVHTRVVW